MSGIAWTKEFLTSMEDAVNMFMPTHAGAIAEGFYDPWNCGKRAQSHFKRSWHIGGTVFCCQRKGLFFAQTEPAGRFIVVDVTACCLRCQPLAQVALIGLCLGGKLYRGLWLPGKSFVKPQLLSDDDHARVNRSAKISHELAHKGVQLVHVNSRDLCCAHFDFVAFFKS